MDKELMAKAKALKPMLWIGKNGLTEQVIEELNKLLKKKKIIKIKFLRNFIEDKNRKEVCASIAQSTNSEIILQIGFTVVLKK